MKMFDADKTRMIGLPYGEKKTITIMLSHFHPINTERYGRTDRQTDRQDRIPILISRISILTRDKNGDIGSISRYIPGTIEDKAYSCNGKPIGSRIWAFDW